MLFHVSHFRSLLLFLFSYSLHFFSVFVIDCMRLFRVLFICLFILDFSFLSFSRLICFSFFSFLFFVLRLFEIYLVNKKSLNVVVHISMIEKNTQKYRVKERKKELFTRKKEEKITWWVSGEKIEMCQKLSVIVGWFHPAFNFTIWLSKAITHLVEKKIKVKNKSQYWTHQSFWMDKMFRSTWKQDRIPR